MGNNRAFTILESVMIATYNKGVLDKDLLCSFLESCRDIDADIGGMVGTLSNTGKDVIEIVLETFGISIPQKPNLPLDRELWTEDHHSIHEEYQYILFDKFFDIYRGQNAN